MALFSEITFVGSNGAEVSTVAAVTKLGTCDNAVIQSNRAYWNNTTSTPARYRSNTAAPSADYEAIADLYIVGGNDTSLAAGPLARAVSGELTGYWGRYRKSTGGIQLFKYVNGAATQLGSTYAYTPANGETLRLRVRCSGNQISLYKNSETSPIIGPITDSTISAAGYVGFVSSNASATDGPHLTYLAGDTLAASGASGSFAITAADATFSGGGVVRPMASFAITASDSTFSGGSAAMVSGSYSATTDSAAFSGGATGDTSLGTISTPALKNNAGSVLANESGISAFVYNVSTGALIVTKTGETTDASGVLSFSDASLVAGTTYRVVIVLATGAEGMDKVAAT